MKDNPFVLPGFGQSGAMSENPLLASMEMMRQAWEGLAKTGNMDPAAMGIMSMDELDKRISDLRAVENWLRMNLSMLGSTIRGMEVQRATMATLKSVVETGMSAAAGAAEAGRTGSSSPLEDVLKAWQGPAPGARQSNAGPTATKSEAADNSARWPTSEDAPATPRKPQPTDQTSEAGHEKAVSDNSDSPGSDGEQPDVLGAAATAAQGWWNMLQQQFQTLAAATVASAEGAMADAAAAAQAASTTPSRKAGAKRAAAAKKSTTAKKAAAPKKSAAAKKAAPQKAAKKTTAKKAAKRSASARKSAR